jgi:hypothetical protein
MPNVVATHRVGDMKTWLEGSENRARLFQEFCANYRIFRHLNENTVSIVFEDADLDKMKAPDRRRARSAAGRWTHASLATRAGATSQLVADSLGHASRSFGSIQGLHCNVTKSS